MIKYLLVVGCFFLSTTLAAAACLPAAPSNTAAFCESFQAAAECHCTSSGLPKGMCSNMGQLYARMLAMFRSVQRACEFQHNTTPQECIDDWNCYLSGGKNSAGGLCSGTGNACG